MDILTTIYTNFIALIQFLAVNVNVNNSGIAWLGAGIAITCGAGTAVGQGLVGMKTIEAVSRQPEATGKLVSLMIITQVIIETTAIYALIISFVLIGK